MTIQVKAVGPLTRLDPQRRTGFEVLMECGAAVLLQFATPAQAALSRTALCDNVGPAAGRHMATGSMAFAGPA